MDFLDKTCKKGLKQKSEHHHCTLHIPNGLTILNFWTKLTQKEYFRSKKEKKKMKITIEFYIFQFVQVPNFSFRKQFRFFETSFPKKDTSGGKQKNEHHH